MESFVDILNYLVAREHELAKKVVNGAICSDPQAILDNAAHTEILKLLEVCAHVIKNEISPTEKKTLKPKLRIIK